MKWGTLYPAAYVNILYRAVCDHLDGPFRFVCLTDDAMGFEAGIETFPIPDLQLAPERYSHGAWPKLGVFQRDLYGLTGRCLFIDLDSAIIDRLEPFFEADGLFRAIGAGPGWARGRTVETPELASGVFAFELGQLGMVLDTFLADREGAYARYPNEQSFIEGAIPDWAPWPPDWVISFKRHLCRPIGIDLVKPPLDPPAGAKIVAFHGDPRPAALIGRRGLWSKPPHSVRCPVGWLEDYWARYGT